MVLSTLAGAGGVTVTSTGGAMSLNGAGQTVTLASAALDVNASAGITIDGTTLSLDGTDSTNLTMTADDLGNKTFTIAATNAGNGVSNIDIDADGAVSIDSSAGSLIRCRFS